MYDNNGDLIPVDSAKQKKRKRMPRGLRYALFALLLLLSLGLLVVSILWGVNPRIMLSNNIASADYVEDLPAEINTLYFEPRTLALNDGDFTIDILPDGLIHIYGVIRKTVSVKIYPYVNSDVGYTISNNLCFGRVLNGLPNNIYTGTIGFEGYNTTANKLDLNGQNMQYKMLSVTSGVKPIVLSFWRDTADVLDFTMRLYLYTGTHRGYIPNFEQLYGAGYADGLEGTGYHPFEMGKKYNALYNKHTSIEPVLVSSMLSYNDFMSHGDYLSTFSVVQHNFTPDGDLDLVRFDISNAFGLHYPLFDFYLDDNTLVGRMFLTVFTSPSAPNTFFVALQGRGYPFALNSDWYTFCYDSNTTYANLSFEAFDVGYYQQVVGTGSSSYYVDYDVSMDYVNNFLDTEGYYMLANAALTSDIQDSPRGLATAYSYNNFTSFSYDDVYRRAYDSGYYDGRIYGYNKGVLDTDGASNNLRSLVLGIIDAPFGVLQDVLNFEVFGINISSLVMFFISLSITVFVIKQFRG
jgi:hypothetical protein